MSEAVYGWNFKEKIEKAKLEGFEVIESAENRLLIDIDGEDTKPFDMRLSWLRSHFDLKEIERWRSKSGKGWHILLSCKPCDFTLRIALHFALGSDPKRETLALMMKADGNEVRFLLKPPSEPLSKIEALMLA